MFTDDLWKGLGPLPQKILGLPYIRELADGSLSRERYLRFLTQDCLYLPDFSVALARTAQACSETEIGDELIRMAHGALEEEGRLRQILTGEDTHLAQKNPVCLKYTAFLQRCSRKTVAESLAALLPCFWIYEYVGKTLVRGLFVGHPYEDWIRMYADPGFVESSQRMRALTNHFAGQAAPGIRLQMHKCFLRASQFERRFWMACYAAPAMPLQGA